MRKLLISILMVAIFSAPALADFASKVAILEKADVTKLSEEKLLDSYMDTLVEIEAVKTFHTTSGFTPKQYDAYRDLLKYRLVLLMEIHTRNLDIPQQMER